MKKFSYAKEISKKYGICIIQATNGSREFMELCL